MKRFIVLLLTIAGIAVGLASCQKAPFITMTGPRSYTFTREGGSQSFTFSCNRDWTISSSESWVRISPSSGTASDGDITVTLTVDPNSTYDSRTATLTVKVEELTETISVTQEENMGFVISTLNFEIGSDGGDIKVPIQANAEYTLDVAQDSEGWLSVKQTKSLSDYNIVLSAKKNDTYDARSGFVYVQYGDARSTITVKQSQLEEIITEQTQFEIGSNGGDIKIPVTTSINYECSLLERASEWLSVKTLQTKSLDTYYLILTAKENTSYDGRVGQVKIYGASKESIITVCQSQLDELIVTKTEFEVGSDGGTIEIPLQTNTTYKSEILGDASSWLSFTTVPSSTKALSDVTVKITVATNVGYDERVGQVKIAGAGKESVVTITQSQLNAIITEQDSYSIDKEGGTIIIPVQSNVDWNCSVVGDTSNWITISDSKTKALNSGSISLTIAANESTDGRVGQIQIYGTNIERYITIKQFGNQTKIDVETPGTLSSLLSEDAARTVQYLVITGPLNNSDWYIIKNLSSIKYLDLKGVTTALPGSFFSGECGTLTEVWLPDNYTSIGNELFKSSSVSSVHISQNTKSIGDYAFYQSRVRFVDNLNVVEEFGDFVFYCSSLQNDLILSNMKSMGIYAFAFISSHIISFSNSITKITEYATSGTSFYGTLIIPDSVQSIGYSNFNNGILDGDLVLGKSITQIGDYYGDVRLATFVGSKFKRVFCKAQTPPVVNTPGIPKTYLGVPHGTLEAYKTADYWKDFLVIEEVDFDALRY